MDIIKSIEHEQMKNKIPELNIGSTVRVHVRIKEGNKERIQVFEGIIIKKQGGGVNATFTVRRISYGVGVEKTFLVHSPMIEKIEVVRVGRARRAKLYYLRDRVGKAAKTKEKVGAKIETKMITVKEEVVPGESVEAENAENTEDIVVAEEVEENVTPVEEKKEEVKAEVKEEVKEETAKEETKKEDDKKED
jgi:large subunit ribosomal protein L19